MLRPHYTRSLTLSTNIPTRFSR